MLLSLLLILAVVGITACGQTANNQIENNDTLEDITYEGFTRKIALITNDNGIEYPYAQTVRHFSNAGYSITDTTPSDSAETYVFLDKSGACLATVVDDTENKVIKLTIGTEEESKNYTYAENVNQEMTPKDIADQTKEK